MGKRLYFLIAFVLLTACLSVFVPTFALRSTVNAAEGRIVAGFLAPIGAPDPNATALYTAADLRKMTDSDGSFVLMNDIDLSGYETWNPIEGFGGVFDGQGYAIKNMSSIAAENTNKYHVGLFMNTGKIDGDAVIKNLAMPNAFIDLSYTYKSSGSPAHYGGAIVSDAYSTTIENCVVTCITPEMSISNGYVGNYNVDYYTMTYVGGLAGRFAGGTVKNCVIDVQMAVTQANTYNNYTYLYVGGLVGSELLSISNCKVSGMIGGLAAAQYPTNGGNMVYPLAYAYVGGLVGNVIGYEVIIENCENNALVYAETAAAGNSGVNKFAIAYAGGMVGRLGVSSKASFTDCVNTGTVMAIGNSTEHYGYAECAAGGIVGFALSIYASNKVTLTLTDCTSDGGLVRAQSRGYSSSWSAAGDLLGGFTNNASGGAATLVMTNCAGSSEINTRSDSNVDTTAYCGGLAGMVRSMGGRVELTVENSRHTGTVNADPTTSATGNNKRILAGGIAAVVWGGTGQVTFQPFCFYAASELEPIGGRVSNYALTPNKNITLVGEENINPAVHTVTFNTNGGTSVASREVTTGEAVDAPTNPTREGFIFGGWYIDAALTHPVAFPYTVTGDITLYAKWESGETLVSDVALQNLSAQGAKASRLMLYSVTDITSTTGVAETTYKLVLTFTGYAQDVHLYVATYDADGALDVLLSAASGLTIVDKLEIDGIPTDVFDAVGGHFTIFVWDGAMQPIIVPVTAFPPL